MWLKTALCLFYAKLTVVIENQLNLKSVVQYVNKTLHVFLSLGFTLEICIKPQEAAVTNSFWVAMS